MKKDSTQTGATLCSSMRPRSATTSWLNKFKLLAFAFMALLSVNAWGETATWNASSGALGSTISNQGGTASGTISTGSFVWNYTRTLKSLKNDKSDFISFSNQYIQLGSGSALEELVFSTSNIPGTITKISIDCASNGPVHTLSVSVGGTSYSCSPTTLPTPNFDGSGNFTGVDNPTVEATGSSSGMIVISFTAETTKKALFIKSITVTYSSGSSRTCNVTWMVNGEEYTIGSPTVEVTGGNRVTTLPTPPTISCGELVFDGWSASTISGESNSAPTDLFSTADAAPIVTGDVTYHAVFTSGGFNRGASSNITDNGKIVLVDDDNYALSSVIEKENSCYYWTYPILVNGSHLSCPPTSCVWTTEEATNSKWYLKKEDKYLNLYDQYDDGDYYSCTYIDNSSDAWNFVSGENNTYTIMSSEAANEPYLYVYSDHTFGGGSNGTNLQIYVYTSGVWVTTCDTKIPLSAPTNLSAGTPTSRGTTLSWTAVEHAGSYTLEYKVSSAGSWTTISPITTTSYNLTGLTPETTYAWRLTAVPSDATTYSNSNTVNGSNFTTSSITYTDLFSGRKVDSFSHPFSHLCKS